jgi:hypothetical protein
MENHEMNERYESRTKSKPAMALTKRLAAPIDRFISLISCFSWFPPRRLRDALRQLATPTACMYNRI